MMDAHRIPLRKTFVRLLMVCLVTISPILVAQEAPAPNAAPVITTPPAAPPTNLKFEHLFIEHGLSDAMVNCILQDRQGFLWFGTEDGLKRYDGYNLQSYRHDPENPGSLSDNSVVSIFEDNSGVLWIGTANEGLNEFKRDTEQFIRSLYAPSPLP